MRKSELFVLFAWSIATLKGGQMMIVDHAGVTLNNLTKSYGSQKVLHEVSFSLNPGQITGLLGENGAGKSTLAKILAGATTPDTGSILIGNKHVSLQTPRESLAHGISFIPQELIYVPRLTVAENICLGRWPRKGFVTSPTQMKTFAESEVNRLGFDLPLQSEMSSLSFAQQQTVEIVKALSRDSKLIILDEPTAALNNDESAQLLSIMGNMALSGASILYISHRLDEVFSICTALQVLRNGSLVFSGDASLTDPAEVISHILGRAEVQLEGRRGNAISQKAVLKIENWSRQQYPSLDAVSLEVHEGEIVGLYGLAGSGAEVVAQTLGGLIPDVVGMTFIDQAAVTTPRSPRHSRLAGIGYVPADRKLQGLVPTLSVRNSLSLLIMRRLAKWGVINAKAELANANGMATDTQLRARSIEQTVGELSGGNQQKVLMASRIAQKPRVLVLQEPTRGVDVGARVELHKLLRKLADSGTGQLVVTSDIEEAVQICDRLLIFREGRVTREFRDLNSETQSAALHAAGGM